MAAEPGDRPRPGGSGRGALKPEAAALRSRIMRAVKGRGTTPERQAAALLRGAGAPFRKNVSRLPGSPDLVVRGVTDGSNQTDTDEDTSGCLQ